MNARVLVAGVGNIFFSDDGFGSAVLQRLGAEPIPGVRCEDYGIRGMHLAFEMLAGYERVILVDAISRRGAPGTLYVIEPDDVAASGTAPDAHRMDLANVFAYVRTLGDDAPPATIVGAEPETIDEGIGLTPVMDAAVEAALPLVRRLVREALAAPARAVKETTCSEV